MTENVFNHFNSCVNSSPQDMADHSRLLMTSRRPLKKATLKVAIHAYYVFTIQSTYVTFEFGEREKHT